MSSDIYTKIVPLPNSLTISELKLEYILIMQMPRNLQNS